MEILFSRIFQFYDVQINFINFEFIRFFGKWKVPATSYVYNIS